MHCLRLFCGCRLERKPEHLVEIPGAGAYSPCFKLISIIFYGNGNYKDLAIIDFHIIDLLVRHDLIERPKTLTKRRYLEIESLLREIAGGLHLSLAELDLYLWFIETGKVLK